MDTRYELRLNHNEGCPPEAEATPQSGQRRHHLRSITPCQHLLLIAEHNKLARIFADYHPVQDASDLQLVLVGHNSLNVAALIIMLVPFDDRPGFAHCALPI